MDHPFGNALAIEMSIFLDELIVLERRRTAIAHAAQALIVGNRMTLAGCQCFIIIFHVSLQSEKIYSAGIVQWFDKFLVPCVVATEDSQVKSSVPSTQRFLVGDDPQDLRTGCPVLT
jgi:hypothetical protein